MVVAPKMPAVDNSADENVHFDIDTEGRGNCHARKVETPFLSPSPLVVVQHDTHAAAGQFREVPD